MLYKLNNDKKGYKKVKRVTLDAISWSEKDLENLVSTHIQDFIYSNDLMTIFTERKGQEEPDIVALDRNGDLYIFELKRWESNKENLLQVLRYGQLFGNSDYNELNELYKKYTNVYDDLQGAHSSYFGLNGMSSLKESEYNSKQHFIIMTNGLDQKTVEAIAYWNKVGINIEAIIYWIFEINGENYIEFNMYSPVEGFLEYQSNCYVLNTDYKDNPHHHNEMMREEKAAVYGNNWSGNIERLQKGDVVYLYQSGVGIVAYGKASGEVEKREKEEEYCMKLNQFKHLKTPLTASKMKEVANQGFYFSRTMYPVSDECSELFMEEINKNHL